VATGILAFEADAKATLYQGNFSHYRDLKDDAARAKSEEAKAKRQESKAPPTGNGANSGDAGPARKPLTYAERIELDGIMQKIDAADAEVARLEAEVSDPGLYTTRAKEAPKLHEAFEAAKAEAARLLERWAHLEERRDAKK